ncbi:spermine synthase [Methyloglobulus sp.]|uniref:spermine/spermidine synthase domain-containing protein n=1 Tax=Methyloglobulus sp. TaxID=2518622 RepID=UPI00398934E0
MYKYDGLVIYQNHDDEGVLEVVEKNGIRSLHFGSSSRQSSITLNNPESLQLAYTRAMASWLLFKETVDDALIIGLGGGSLARHLLYHFPECRLRAIEYRASVVKIARSHFGLPLDSRLKVIVGDGGSYVHQHAQTCSDQYSLILIDAFDFEGMAQSIASITFFNACKILLKQDGILVINLWGTETNLCGSCLHWLEQVFNDKVLILPVRNRGNMIAVAFNQDVLRYEMKDLRPWAIELEQQYQIEFPKFLKDFNKHNSCSIQAVIKK